MFSGATENHSGDWIVGYIRQHISLTIYDVKLMNLLQIGNLYFFGLLS